MRASLYPMSFLVVQANDCDSIYLKSRSDAIIYR